MEVNDIKATLKEGQELVDWIPIWDKIQTDYQVIRFYETEKKELILTLDTFVQFIEGISEQTYHNNLIQPALSINPEVKNVLILGGGDGLAARTIFKHKPDVNITLVELDGKMIELFKTHPRLREMNEGSISKCTTYIEDAIFWVARNEAKRFDIIICDFPDPTNKTLKKLYSQGFLTDVAFLLNEKGVISIQCNTDIASTVDNIITEIFGTAATIEYKLPHLGEGSMVIGRKI